MGRFKTLQLVLSVVACSALSGCLDDEGANDPSGASFIALARDFSDFLSWEHFEVGDGSAPMDHPGAIGPRIAYLNRPPAAAASEFPVGTIIVKTVEDGPPETWSIHGMAKRGGGFNRSGAVGWEYFQLYIAYDTGAVGITWRGEDPPAGHGYCEVSDVCGSEMQVACNHCHAEARANDSIMSAPLRALLSH